MSRNAIIAIAFALLFLCCCFVIVFSATAFFVIDTVNSDSAPISQIDAYPHEAGTPAPPLRPTIVPDARPRSGSSTEDLLRQMEAPAADPIDLAARLRPELGAVPRVVNETTPNYEVGDVIDFWVSNTDEDRNFQIKAELVVKSEHLYMWVERGEVVDKGALQRSAQLFDTQIYPTNREFFGSEWSPGVDNDPRLHILHATGIGGTVAGYYSSADEVSSLINPFSNEKEMFYINLSNTKVGDFFYNAVLAHEFQHMIHWHEDLNESTWMNEGASELAAQLNALGRVDDSVKPDQVFANDPDLQLNTWPDSDESYAHYGNAYLFMSYFLSRFGEEATQALIADPANGMQSVDDVLTQLGLGQNADQFFGDWVIANWLDDPSQGDGRWGYPDYDIDPMTTAERFRRLPANGTGDVHQYAADYIRINGGGDITIEFAGQNSNRLAATDAYSGQWAWWSNRVDESDTRLTLPVDLSGVDAATLRFRTWYDIEELWDYAYVGVSSDGGATWTLLETDRTTRENPQGTAYGPGYTGVSGSSGPEWVLEEVDLSPYAGQQVQIRFEQITDAAVTQPGMFIDDVEIPEIGYFNDFENGPGDWQAEGWLLTDNRLAQRWLVQLIETGRDGSVEVHQVPVAANGQGLLQLQDVSDAEDLILTISALAPVTVETASYQFSVSATR